MGKTLGKILTKADALIGALSMGLIVVGGGIIIGDKAVHVIARYVDGAATLIKGKKR